MGWGNFDVFIIRFCFWCGGGVVMSVDVLYILLSLLGGMIGFGGGYIFGGGGGGGFIGIGLG